MIPIPPGSAPAEVGPSHRWGTGADASDLLKLLPIPPGRRPELWVIGGYWLREVRRPFGAHISTNEPASDGRFELSVAGDAGGSHCIDFLPAYLCLKLDIMR